MSADKNSLFIAGAIVSGALAATLGMVARDRVDVPINSSVATSELPGTRMASRQEPGQGIDIPEREYFEQMVDMLKQAYVEPIADDQKLVDGAVRGMVGSLEDPNSLYYDKEGFRVFQNAREGRYEGIGVDLAYVFATKDSTPDAGPRVPKLTVSAVTPNGPAAKAGVLPGDVVDSIDGRWVANLDLIDQFRVLQQKVNDKKAAPEELRKLRVEFRSKSEHSMMPAKAREKLIMGTSGVHKVTWLRAGKLRETTLTKGLSSAFLVEDAQGSLRVRVMPGIGPELAKHAGAKSLKLDLRNNPFSDLYAVQEALSALAPAGVYGRIVNNRGGSLPLKVAKGAAAPRTYTLIVDKSTTGGAAILARALEAKGIAKLEGQTGDPISIEVMRLPNGTGFTLAKGVFKAEASK